MESLVRRTAELVVAGRRLELLEPSLRDLLELNAFHGQVAARLAREPEQAAAIAAAAQLEAGYRLLCATPAVREAYPTFEAWCEAIPASQAEAVGAAVRRALVELAPSLFEEAPPEADCFRGEAGGVAGDPGPGGAAPK